MSEVRRRGAETMTPKTIDFEDSADKLAELIEEHGDEDGTRNVFGDDSATLRKMLIEEYEESFLSGREYQVAVLEMAGVPRDEIADALGIKRNKVRHYWQDAQKKKERAITTERVFQGSW